MGNIEKEKKILMIGTFPDPMTGESFANKILFENVTKYFPKFKVDRIHIEYTSFETEGKFTFRKTLYFILLNRYLYKIFQNDYIYITCGETFFGIIKKSPFIFLAKILGKKLTLHFHGNSLEKFNQEDGKIKMFIKKMIISQAGRGVVLTKHFYDNLTPFLPKNKIVYLHNFVEDNLLELKKQFNDKKLKLLFLSNVIQLKGVFDLLDALIILQEKKIDFHLDVAGSLPKRYEKDFFEYQRKLGNKVTYHGVVLKKEKENIFKNSNIFILPSKLNEGQPISLLEAIATENVIISTRLKGIVDIFTEGQTGYYVDKNSPKQIAEKIILIGNNLSEWKIKVAENSKIIKDNFRIKNFVENFIKIIDHE